MELCHHGIKGQKWGVRRYQFADGSLTPNGKKRYKIRQNSNGVKRATSLMNMRVDELVNKTKAKIT